MKETMEEERAAVIRDRMRAPRAGAIAGIVFSILLIISLVLIPKSLRIRGLLIPCNLDLRKCRLFTSSSCDRNLLSILLTKIEILD